jgi:transcriptional regulator with XRE-family HTH domain
MKKESSIREQLGLTQEDMALYLQVSRGQLALYETHKRDLPTDALLKLVEIEVFLSQTNTEIGFDRTHLKPQQEKMLLVLQRQAIVYQHKQLIVERKLESIKKNYNKGLMLLQVLQHLLQKAKAEGSTTELLEEMQNEAQQTIEKNGLHVQVLHQVKWQGITSTKEQIEAEILKVKEDLEKL